MRLPCAALTPSTGRMVPAPDDAAGAGIMEGTSRMTNRFEIVDDPDDAEAADVVVCRRLTSPLLLPDNWIDLCSKCGEAIQHRPHVPKTPPKICDECAAPIMRAEHAKGGLVTMITPKTAAEVDAYFRKKNAN